ncbi:MAG: metallophosphoesterase [Elusimicrobiota bacterium]|jgi:hypothetical protein
MAAALVLLLAPPCPALAASASTASAQGFRFVGFSDSRGRDRGVNDAVLSLLAAHIKDASGAELVVFPGDMVSGGGASFLGIRDQLAHWREVMEPLYNDERFFGARVYPGLGNHEVWGTDGEKAFLEVFPKLPGNGPKGSEGLAYSFDRGTVHFVMLDTTGSGPGGKQGAAGLPLDWLRSDLKAARERGAEHVFVFGHDPAFPVASHVAGSLPQLGRKRLFRGYDLSGVKARDAFWKLLAEFKVAAYVCGHEHLNAIESIDGVFQVVAGAAGAPLYRPNPCGGAEAGLVGKDLEDFEKRSPYYDLLGYPSGKGGNCQASPDFWGASVFGYFLFEVAGGSVTVQLWGVEPKPDSRTEVPEGASVRLLYSRTLR